MDDQPLAQFKVRVFVRCTAEWGALAKTAIADAAESRASVFDGMQTPTLQPLDDYENEPLRAGEIEWFNLMLVWPEFSAENTPMLLTRHGANC